MTIPSLSSLAIAFILACAIAAVGIMVSKRKDFLIRF
jgi:hypothetical protein